jgi:hypothetical protein
LIRAIEEITNDVKINKLLDDADSFIDPNAAMRESLTSRTRTVYAE